jgi:hypothetical protein
MITEGEGAEHDRWGTGLAHQMAQHRRVTGMNAGATTGARAGSRPLVSHHALPNSSMDGYKFRLLVRNILQNLRSKQNL